MKIFMYYWIGLTILYIIYYAIVIMLDLNSKQGKKEEAVEEFHAADEPQDEDEDDSVIVDDPDAMEYEEQQPEETEGGEQQGAAVDAESKEPSAEDYRQIQENNLYQSLKQQAEANCSPVIPRYQEEMDSVEFMVAMNQPMHKQTKMIRQIIDQ